MMCVDCEGGPEIKRNSPTLEQFKLNFELLTINKQQFYCVLHADIIIMHLCTDTCKYS